MLVSTRDLCAQTLQHEQVRIWTIAPHVAAAVRAKLDWAGISKPVSWCACAQSWRCAQQLSRGSVSKLQYIKHATQCWLTTTLVVIIACLHHSMQQPSI